MQWPTTVTAKQKVEMATFVAKNSGGVKKKPMIILKELIFIRFSFNKRRQRLAGVRGFTMK